MKNHLLWTVLFLMLSMPAISQEIPHLKMRTDSNKLLIAEKWKNDSIKIFSRDTLIFSKDSIILKIQRPFDMEKFKQFSHTYPITKDPTHNLPVVTPPEENYSLIVVAPDTTVHYHLRNGLNK